MAEELGVVASGSVDVVYLSAVFHWITRKTDALAEIFRVWHPAGNWPDHQPERITARVVGAPVDNAVLSREPFRGRVHIDDYITDHSGVTTTELLSLLAASGFEVEQVGIHLLTQQFRDGRHVHDFFQSSTFGNYLHHVPADLRELAQQEFIAACDRRRTEDGITFTRHGLIAVARKPGG